MKEPETINEDQAVYFEKVLAHRTYQYSMSLYKELRYKEGNRKDPTLNWQKVDAWLRKSIERYKGITHPSTG